MGSGKGRNPHENQMRVAIADECRNSRGTLFDWESRAGRAAHRSEREKTLTAEAGKGGPEFIKEQRLLITCLMETRRVTPQGLKMTPEDRRRAVAQRAAEIVERRAIFDASNNS